MYLLKNISYGIWYCLHQYWIDASDPRINHLPLFEGGPEIVLLILATYLLFVKIIGPWWMYDRKPYDVFIPMLLYDIIMAIINAVIFLSIIVNHIDYGQRFLQFKFPDPNDHSERTISEINNGYLCYLTRLADLLDTVFFVLRKKQQQITFLHIYHHTLVPLIGWMALKIAPQAPVIILFLMLNSFIHAVMYTYYALAAFGNHLRRYLWWKKYITQLQLLQFMVCGLYGILLYFQQTGYPMIWFIVAVGQNPIFFYMFYDFYRQAYQDKSKKLNKNDKSTYIMNGNGKKSL